MTQVVGAVDENMPPLPSTNGIEVISFSKLQSEVSSSYINYLFFFNISNKESKVLLGPVPISSFGIGSIQS